jgi:glycosyltransferase involved in cell wall biosynthesis
VVERLRILCVTPWFPAWPGAQSGNFILDSVLALEALGHSVKVLAVQPWYPRWAGLLHADWGRPRLRPETHSSSLGLERVGYLSVPRNYFRNLSNWAFVRRVAPAIEQVVKSFTPQVVVAHTEMIGLAGVAAGSRMDVPAVIVLHGINTSPRLNTPVQLSVVGRALAGADRVVLVGEPLREHFRRMAGRDDHFRIVHNGFRVSNDVVCLEHHPWGTPVRFISVSNLHEGKGIDLNLQALGRLLQNGQQGWRYTVVGDGRERASLEAMAADLGIAGRVHFVGAVGHKEVYRHLARADVLVLPSYREAFGVAYLEAMACGLLTIGVRGQGPEAFITDRRNGLLIPPRDVDALATVLAETMARPDEMQALAEKGREFVQEEFTWQRHAERMTSVLREVVAR